MLAGDFFLAASFDSVFPTDVLVASNKEFSIDNYVYPTAGHNLVCPQSVAASIEQLG